MLGGSMRSMRVVKMTETKRDRYIRILSGLTDTGATLTAYATAEVLELLKEPVMNTDPARHGHWIRHDYADIVDGCYVPNYECSVCHTWKQDDSDYCPDCGANLDGMRLTDG